MNIANKTFRNNRTGETIRVIDAFEDIAILENKQKINVKNLMDPSQYTEQIDPSTFFNNQTAYDGLVEKIKSIPTDNMMDESITNQIGNDPSFRPAMEESAIIQTTEEDEMAELARKYGAQIDNQNDIQKQNEAFNKILNPEETPVTPKTEVRVNNTQQVEANREYQQPPVQRVEDPIISMFRNVKRNVDFNISIDVNNKIPRLDFIEMMEDSYEISIIDFLAEEFTNQILNNPSSIKESIKSEINKLAYGEKTAELQQEVSKEVENESQVKETKKEDTKLTAKQRIDLISEMDSVEEVEAALKGEKAKSVITAGNKRIKELKK